MGAKVYTLLLVSALSVSCMTDEVTEEPSGNNGTETSMTVFQRRINGSVDFYRGWDSYEQGFGNAAGEFWLGLHHIYHLTANKKNELLVELFDGTAKAYAHYSLFSLGGPNNNYWLYTSGFSDGLNSPGNSLGYHNGHQFSTRDADNDVSALYHCAHHKKGAWWYNKCIGSNLNGIYNGNAPTGIIWGTWRGTSLPAVRMLLKT